MPSSHALSRLIRHHTHEPVRNLTAIGPAVWKVELASGPCVVWVKRTSPRLLREQTVLQSLGPVGVPTEQLLDIWSVPSRSAG